MVDRNYPSPTARNMRLPAYVIRLAKAANVACILSACAVGAAPDILSNAGAQTQSLSAREAAALAVVTARTAAYNAHDIDAFITTYSEDVRIYEYPDTFLGAGTARMRSIFGPQFADGEGEITVYSQRALENTVVSDESVTYYGRTEHNIGIYTVENGKITQVRLIEPAE